MPHGTAIRDTGSGSFATRKRGGPDHAEVHRLAKLGRGVQTIAAITGSCMEDVARILRPEPEGKSETAPKPSAEPMTYADHRKARDARFRTMWLADVTRVEICHALGISQSTLDLDRARLRLPPRPVGRKPKKRAQSAAGPLGPSAILLQRVADKYGMTVAALVEDDRSNAVVMARQEAMHLLRTERRASFPSIGRVFGGRDHSTVLTSIRRHEARLAWIAILASIAEAIQSGEGRIAA